ncbi:MAG: hypothetical protein QXI09_03490 [Candidatus Aenigmatarchaeota archaeon]
MVVNMEEKMIERIVSDPILKSIIEEFKNVKKTLDILIQLPSSPILFTTEYYALKKRVEEHLKQLLNNFKEQISEKIPEIILMVLTELNL